MTDTTGSDRQPASRTAAVAATIVFALLAGLGWYLYLQQRTETASQIATLETAVVELERLATSLEAELDLARSERQQSQQELENERAAIAELRHSLAEEQTSAEELQSALQSAREEQRRIATDLEQEVARLVDSNALLETELQQRLAHQQSLDTQIAEVSGDVESKQAALARAREDIAKLNHELDQSRLDQGELKARYTELDRRHDKETRHFATLKQRLEQELNESRIEIRQLKNRMTVIDLTSEVLFASGSARIKPAGQKVLDLIAESLNTYPDRAISIEGHTDNVPVGKNLPYVSNWDLSAARAMAAVDYLQQKAAVAPERLRVVGHGEHHPIASNETAGGRQRNRRIEIRLLPGSDYSS